MDGKVEKELKKIVFLHFSPHDNVESQHKIENQIDDNLQEDSINGIRINEIDFVRKENLHKESTNLTSNPPAASLQEKNKLFLLPVTHKPCPLPMDTSSPCIDPSLSSQVTLSLSLQRSFQTPPTTREFENFQIQEKNQLSSQIVSISQNRTHFNSWISISSLQKQLLSVLVGCVWLIVVTSECFWLIQCFDMVADVKGMKEAMILIFTGFCCSLFFIYLAVLGLRYLLKR